MGCATGLLPTRWNLTYGPGRVVVGDGAGLHDGYVTETVGVG